MTQEFDTTTKKNTALTAIKQRVEETERALYNRAHALAKVEAEHSKLIVEATLALDNVLAQALQQDILEEDLELHLPDYAEDLSARLDEVRNIMALANTIEYV